MINQARLWRKILLNIIEAEPGLADFIPEISSVDKSKTDSDKSDSYYKKLFSSLKTKVDRAWFTADVNPIVSR